MALQSFLNSIGSGIRVNLMATDSAFIAAGGLISSKDDTAILGVGSDHIVDVQGTVVAGVGFAIGLGNGAGTSNEYVLIESSGFAGSYDDEYVISIAASSSVVENRGRIYGTGASGGLGVDIGSAYGTSQLINTGTIEAKSLAVQHAGGDTLIVANGGTIKSGVWAFLDPIGSVGSVDQLTNTGIMVGTIDLGGGNDTYNGASGHLTGHLLAGTGADTAIGGSDNDWFEGGSENDTLRGNGGADTLKGDAGDDVISGGAGKDTLTGGLNKDVFVFDAPLNKLTNVDQIADFSHIDDTIRLNHAVFKGLAAGHTLNPAFFWKGTAAHDANDHIIYDGVHGRLYYDSDGTGSHAQVLFAVLQNHPHDLAANDFAVV